MPNYWLQTPKGQFFCAAVLFFYCCPTQLSSSTFRCLVAQLFRIGNILSHLHYIMFPGILKTMYFLLGYDLGNMSVSKHLRCCHESGLAPLFHPFSASLKKERPFSRCSRLPCLGHFDQNILWAHFFIMEEVEKKPLGCTIDHFSKCFFCFLFLHSSLFSGIFTRTKRGRAAERSEVSWYREILIWFVLVLNIEIKRVWEDDCADGDLLIVMLSVKAFMCLYKRAKLPNCEK